MASQEERTLVVAVVCICVCTHACPCLKNVEIPGKDLLEFLDKQGMRSQILKGKVTGENEKFKKENRNNVIYKNDSLVAPKTNLL